MDEVKVLCGTKSPLGVIITASRWQMQARKGLCEGSLSAKLFHILKEERSECLLAMPTVIIVSIVLL